MMKFSHRSLGEAKCRLVHLPVLLGLALMLIPMMLSPLALNAAEQSDETRSTLDDQQSVAVTIYNSDLALVKDQRRIKLKTGLNKLSLRDVSARMRPETALLRNPLAPASISVLEQNFDFDLLTPQKLIEKYVGKTVSVIRTNQTTGTETSEQAKILSANSGIVMQIGDRIETGMPGRLVFPDIPENLRDRPTLVMQIQNKQTAEQTLELSYLTGGLSWKADYVAELNAADDKLDLSGWVTLTNTSGSTYKNARLQLVAGDVNRVREELAIPSGKVMRMTASPAPVELDQMQEQSLLEYHLYTLNRPTTIAENQTKQVALLSAGGVLAKKQMVLRGADYYYQSSYGELGQKMKVGVFIEFENKESNQLGIPLPKGIMRVYKKDNAGNAQFVGEDHLDHTPKNERVRLKLGEAFDVTADKKQTDFKKLPSNNKGNGVFESAYEITLKNAKQERVTVDVIEPIPGDWRILKESHPGSKETSNTAVWKVEVPAEGKAVLSYRVQVRY